MPLSKARNRERMREFRLHAQKQTEAVQPKTPLARRQESEATTIPELDADGNPIPDYE